MMTLVLQISSFVGAVTVFKILYDLCSFLALYLKPPAYHRYLRGVSSYALVTGATDGIGKAVATELYAKGFNLIIHGRNEEKLRKVREQVKGTGSRDVKIWVADATAPNPDFDAAVAEWEDLHIPLVINNVGGSSMRPVTVDQIPEDVLMEVIRRNALFPFMLTRALLPKLRKLPGPVELVYIGSAAGDMPLPTLNPYCAAKAFLKRLSICINQDERFGTSSNVTTSYFNVGSVVTENHKVPVSLFAPHADDFAKCVVARVGCGERVVFPYIFHAFESWSASIIPSTTLETTILRKMEGELTAMKKA